LELASLILTPGGSLEGLRPICLNFFETIHNQINNLISFFDYFLECFEKIYILQRFKEIFGPTFSFDFGIILTYCSMVNVDYEFRAVSNLLTILVHFKYTYYPNFTFSSSE
jgi:hypothetical protein